MIEVWKNIMGWKGLYQISNFGRMKSLKRPFVVKDRLVLEAFVGPRPVGLECRLFIESRGSM